MSPFAPHPLIVIIATSHARTDLLLERALPSVYNQTINPYQVYIVDDNPVAKNKHRSGEFRVLQNRVRELREQMLGEKFRTIRAQHPRLGFENLFHTTVIPNRRTRANSGTGAWNSAAIHALQYRNKKLFLAFLDDDDAWDPSHLAMCWEAARQKARCAAVISGFRRREADGKTRDYIADRASFSRENIFIRNPGLQGSNLFIALKAFWRIGGFDESLPSCTDRDLGMRLLEFTQRSHRHHIAFTHAVTLTHYAESGARVTNNTAAKQHGLDGFYHKYQHQFGEKIRARSLDRAAKLFGYQPQLATQNTRTASPEPTKIKPKSRSKSSSKPAPFNLHIGTVSDNARNIRAQLNSFLEMLDRDRAWLSHYTFHILDNADEPYEVRPLALYFQHHHNLNIAIVERGATQKLSIAAARTALQCHILKTARALHGDDFITWIVDDDALFRANLTNGDTIVPPYFQVIAQHRGYGINALFAKVTDAPPLPFTSTVRTQLLDFAYNLSRFAHCCPTESARAVFAPLPPANPDHHEPYYDLSDAQFDHLERPQLWQLPPPNGDAHDDRPMHQTFGEFLATTAQLPQGLNVFRKITFAPECIGRLGGESIHRGGNTIIYTPAMLAVANYTPSAAYNRRSDFNWALINRRIYQRSLKQITLPLQHDRSLQRASLGMEREKFQADLHGMLFYRLLQDILSTKTEMDPKRVRKLTAKHQTRVRQLIRKLKTNHLRSITLCYQIEAQLAARGAWWYGNRYRAKLNPLLEQNLQGVRTLKFEMGERRMQNLLQSIKDSLVVHPSDISRVAAEMNKLRDETDCQTGRA